MFQHVEDWQLENANSAIYSEKRIELVCMASFEFSKSNNTQTKLQTEQNAVVLLEVYFM